MAAVGVVREPPLRIADPSRVGTAHHAHETRGLVGWAPPTE